MKKKYYLYKLNEPLLNFLAIIIFIVMMLLTVLITKERLVFFYDDSTFMFFAILLMIPYFILHEIVHSIAYVLHGAKYKNITYGAHLEKGVLCCLCKQNISKRAILTSLLYPFIFLGVITYIIGIVFHLKLLIFLSILNISGCAGDLVMFFDLVRIKKFSYSEYDDPTSFALYSSDDLSNKRLFGIDYVGSGATIERKDFRKAVVSKTSTIIFVLLVLLILIMLVLL